MAHTYYPGMTKSEIAKALAADAQSTLTAQDTPESIAFFGEPRTTAEIAAQWQGLTDRIGKGIIALMEEGR